MYKKKHKINYGFPITVIGDGKVAQAYVDGKQAIKEFSNPITVIGKGTHSSFFLKRKVQYLTPETVKKIDGSVIVAIRPQNTVEAFTLIKNRIDDPKLITSLVSGLTLEDISELSGVSDEKVAIATLNTNIRYRTGMICWHDNKKYVPGKTDECIFGQTFGGLTSPGKKCLGYLKKVHGDNERSANQKILDGVVLIGSASAIHAKIIWLTYEKEAVKQITLKRFLEKLSCGSYPVIIQHYFENLNKATKSVFGRDYQSLNMRSFHSVVSALIASPHDIPIQIGEHIKTVVTRGGCTETKLSLLTSICSFLDEEKLTDIFYGIREKSLQFREMALGRVRI